MVATYDPLGCDLGSLLILLSKNNGAGMMFEWLPHLPIKRKGVSNLPAKKIPNYCCQRLATSAIFRRRKQHIIAPVQLRRNAVLKICICVSYKVLRTSQKIDRQTNRSLPISGKVDAATQMADKGSIPRRVKAKTIKIGIYNFSA